MDAHLTSIRDFEDFAGGKCFSQLQDKDVGNYRKRLLEKGEIPKDQGGLSTSTIRHRASHLAAFFKWLTKQDGYRRLGSNLPEYLALPRQNLAKVLSRSEKRYPSIDEAVSMVQSMPSKTRPQRRDRAIVAGTFLLGLRAAALSSMRLKHVDCAARTAVQDAREMRAKNGKSFTIGWFPVPDEIVQVFVTWIEELAANGFGQDDALFPDIKYLSRQKIGKDVIPILGTSGPVNRAFRIASQGCEHAYSPHSARHCLKALGDQLCTNAEKRKAWSLNLGHETVAITETYYGKMNDDTRIQLMSTIKVKDATPDDEKT